MVYLVRLSSRSSDHAAVNFAHVEYALAAETPGTSLLNFASGSSLLVYEDLAHITEIMHTTAELALGNRTQ